MKHERISRLAKQAVNLSLDATLVAEAKALQLNVSQASEAGLAAAVSKARGEAWLRENIAALEAWNVWIEENGLPLEEHRLF